MKNRGDKKVIRAFDLLIQSKQGIYYELAPQHIHRRNND
jgi:hypothetical protein